MTEEPKRYCEKCGAKLPLKKRKKRIWQKD